VLPLLRLSRDDTVSSRPLIPPDPAELDRAVEANLSLGEYAEVYQEQLRRHRLEIAAARNTARRVHRAKLHARRVAYRARRAEQRLEDARAAAEARYEASRSRPSS
jgi:hypothetical protein